MGSVTPPGSDGGGAGYDTGASLGQIGGGKEGEEPKRCSICQESFLFSGDSKEDPNWTNTQYHHKGDGSRRCKRCIQSQKNRKKRTKTRRAAVAQRKKICNFNDPCDGKCSEVSSDRLCG